MRLRELVLLLRWDVVGVFVCVCGIVLRRRGRAVVVGGKAHAVCRRALTRARAGTTCLPYIAASVEVTFHASRR